ncbi:MAG: Maf family protein, partial [Lachnospiraceae bacterium]|nr:Maf family protein [Lachnospiraceae bacterium]
MKVILGSSSPRRREILTQAGIEYEVIVSDCEEVISSTVPSEVVKELSRQKAEDVFKKALDKYWDDKDMLVIGADTVVAFEDTIYGKPSDRDDAIRMLKNLSGRVHQVYTGVTLLTGDKKITFADATDVSVYEVSNEEIEKYVDSGEPMDKAGAYAIQGGFAKFIKEIKGEYNNVVGFPIAR